jgi:mono/diheme cytochrome c family protein
MMRLAVAFASLWLFATCARAASTNLRFFRDGELVKEADLAALKKSCELAAVVIDDPVYKKKKSYLAFPLKDVLAFGFGASAKNVSAEDVFFEALDGYVKPAPSARVLEDGGYVVFADSEKTHGSEPAWEPLDRRGTDPGPYYVVWAKDGQTEAKGYPWPYEVTAIDVARFEKKYPHVLPADASRDSAAWKGFELFRDRCVSCHAVNGEGGDVGPDLNVPRSIVEYRPIDQVKAYIRDPDAFRHSKMPSHADLTDADLDRLITYFSAMKTQKHDRGKSW